MQRRTSWLPLTTGKISKIQAKVEKEIDKMIVQFQKEATKQKEKLADKQEDLKATMHKQHNTMLREVLPQMEPVDSVRLLTWFSLYHWHSWCNSFMLHGWGVGHSCATEGGSFCWQPTPGLKSLHASPSVSSPVLTSSPVLWAHSPPPLALPMSITKASGTPVRFSLLVLIIGTRPKKHEHFSNSASDDQCNKRAHIRIKKEPINDGSYGSNVNARSAPLVTKHDKHDPTHKHSNISSGCSLQQIHHESGNGTKPQTRNSKQHWQPATAPKSPSPSIPPVQPRLMLTLIMWWWRILGVWEMEMETPSWVWVRMMLTRMMTSLTQKLTCRRTLLTPVLSQQLGMIASCA